MIDDLFGPSKSDIADALQESTKLMTSYVGAIVEIMLKKGICTEEELDKAQNRLLAYADQHYEERKEKALQEWEEKLKKPKNKEE